MANNRFSKELEDLLKEERKAISLDGSLQNDIISEQQDNVTYEDVLKDLEESIAEEQEKPIIEQPEETFSIEDTFLKTLLLLPIN